MRNWSLHLIALNIILEYIYSFLKHRIKKQSKLDSV